MKRKEYQLKKSLYENIMQNICKIIKHKLNEDLLSDLDDDDNDDDSEFITATYDDFKYILGEEIGIDNPRGWKKDIIKVGTKNYPQLIYNFKTSWSTPKTFSNIEDILKKKGYTLYKNVSYPDLYFNKLNTSNYFSSVNNGIDVYIEKYKKSVKIFESYPQDVKDIFKQNIYYSYIYYKNDSNLMLAKCRDYNTCPYINKFSYQYSWDLKYFGVLRLIDYNKITTKINTDKLYEITRKTKDKEKRILYFKKYCKNSLSSTFCNNSTNYYIDENGYPYMCLTYNGAAAEKRNVNGKKYQCGAYVAILIQQGWEPLNAMEKDPNCIYELVKNSLSLKVYNKFNVYQSKIFNKYAKDGEELNVPRNKQPDNLILITLDDYLLDQFDEIFNS